MISKINFILFRALTSLIFIYAGLNHFLKAEKIFTRISKSDLYGMIPNENLFKTAIFMSGFIMVTGGVFLLIGFMQRKVSLALIIMLIPITLTVQLDNLNDLGPFFKNVAITGSLIFILNFKQYETQTSPVRHPNNTY